VLLLRSLIFTLLGPCLIAGCVPWALGPKHLASGAWQMGWILIAVGVAGYFICAASFLAALGTPAIFFTRSLRAVWGEEPRRLVRASLYRYSRNPMYLSVLTIIFGQACIFASRAITIYGFAAFVLFHAIVVFVEEPHLRRRDPAAFEQMVNHTPRWLGKSSSTR